MSTRDPTPICFAASATPARVGRSPVSVPLFAPRPFPRPARVSLYIEDLRCAGTPGSYDVYMDLPADAAPDEEHLVGRVTPYGPQPEPGEPAPSFAFVLDASDAWRRVPRRADAGYITTITIVPAFEWGDPVEVARIGLGAS